ncbi:Transmembrane protein 70 homolog, mitochondrial [Linum grandiflorum]
MGRSAILHLIRSQTRSISSASFTSSPASGYQAHRTITCFRHQNAKPSFHPTVTTQTRWASQAAAATEEDDRRISIGPRKDKSPPEDEDDKDSGVVYRGPISSTIKKVKMLSLSTCCLSVSLGPVITFMTSTDSNVILKGAVASSVIFFSASTTAALHWFVSPYIHKLRWQPGSDSFVAEQMSWMGSYVPETIKFADIRVAETNRPYVTFMANKKFYFIDTEHCQNKALLARLTPQKQESAFKNL